MFVKVLLLSAVCCLAFADYDDLHHHSDPIPYNFGYQVQGHEGGHFRKEQGNGQGHVQGSYGYTDEKGVLREVHYVADDNGFRAEVKTNEPGTLSKNPADVKLFSNANYDHHQYHGGNLHWHGL